MMPKKDWETIDDDWAAHDLAKGNQHGDLYPLILAGRYGKIRQSRRLCAQGADGQLRGVPRHVRRPQRDALSSHDRRDYVDEQSGAAELRMADLPLRSGADVFVFRRDARVGAGAHPVQRGHGDVQVINNNPQPAANLWAHVAVYNLDGSLAYEHETKLTAAPDIAAESRADRFSGVCVGRPLHQAGPARCGRPIDLEQISIGAHSPTIPTTWLR